MRPLFVAVALTAACTTAPETDDVPNDEGLVEWEQSDRFGDIEIEPAETAAGTLVDVLAPEIEVNDVIDVRDISGPIGEKHERPLWVGNVGFTDLVITDIEFIDANFMGLLSDLPLTVEPGGEVNLGLELKSHLDPFEIEAVITHNGGKDTWLEIVGNQPD